MIRTILVPTDFSEDAQAALAHAEALARSCHAELLLQHVRSELPSVGSDGLGFAPPGLTLEMKEALDRAIAERVVAVQERGVAARGLQVLGLPHVNIVDVAQREHADLIVIGSHGRRAFARFMLGSVSERVVRSSPVPVLVVRGPHEP